MLVLDTDHFSELQRDSIAGQRLAQRLETSAAAKALTIITVEEQLRGWLAQITRHHEPHPQIAAYAKLQLQIEIFANGVILPWDDDSAELYLKLRGQGIRIGTLDLRIASIALAHGFTILTRSHFAQVPNLQFENWLD